MIGNNGVLVKVGRCLEAFRMEMIVYFLISPKKINH